MYLPPSYEQNSYVRLHKRHPWQHIAKTVEVRELPVREQDWPYVSCGLGIGTPRPRRDRRRLRLPLASVTPSNIIDFLSMSSCPSQGPMSWYLIPSRSPSLTSTRFHDWDRFSGFPKIQSSGRNFLHSSDVPDFQYITCFHKIPSPSHALLTGHTPDPLIFHENPNRKEILLFPWDPTTYTGRRWIYC